MKKDSQQLNHLSFGVLPFQSNAVLPKSQRKNSIRLALVLISKVLHREMKLHKNTPRENRAQNVHS